MQDLLLLYIGMPIEGWQMMIYCTQEAHHMNSSSYERRHRALIGFNLFRIFEVVPLAAEGSDILH